MNPGLPFWQLLTILAIPSLLALLGILMNGRATDRIERRLDRFEDRLSSLEGLHHQEIRQLMEILTSYVQRLVRVEERMR